MGDDYRYATALQVAAAIRSRQVSPVEVLDATLARIDALNDRLVAVIWRNDDEARPGRPGGRRRRGPHRSGGAAALPRCADPHQGSDRRRRLAGHLRILGVPDTPSRESELIVEAFRRAGFVLTARTNTPEFGPLTAAENDRYGISRNPWNLDRTPGGSSGGAGAATAAGLFPVAHGNDGGGSIRIPASCCGLVGLKVSRGRVPTLMRAWEGGVVQGVVTRDVADTAAILDVTSAPGSGPVVQRPCPRPALPGRGGRRPRPAPRGPRGGGPLWPTDRGCLPGRRPRRRRRPGRPGAPRSPPCRSRSATSSCGPSSRS